MFQRKNLELVVFFQWVSLIRCQLHLWRDQYALPVCLCDALSTSSDIDAMNVKGVGHCAILGILDLEHLSQAEVLKDPADWA